MRGVNCAIRPPFPLLGLVYLGTVVQRETSLRNSEIGPRTPERKWGPADELRYSSSTLLLELDRSRPLFHSSISPSHFYCFHQLLWFLSTFSLRARPDGLDAMSFKSFLLRVTR